MLMAKGLLEAIKRGNKIQDNKKHNNNDHDLGEVLSFYSTRTEHLKLRCVDGIKRAYPSDK